MVTMSTQTITEFLLARIAEDEKAALAVQPAGRPLELGALHWLTSEDAVGDSGGYIVAYSVPGAAPRAHIARHDPARVLAECAAKRAIIQLRGEAERNGYDNATAYLGDALYALASVYRLHPDYDKDWE